MKHIPLYSILLGILSISNAHAYEGDTHDFFLPNGMKVIIMEKHAKPEVGVGIFYNVGAHDELWGQRGINAVVAELMSKGTDRYSKEKIEEVIFQYSKWYGWKYTEDMTYFISILRKDDLELGLDIESDRMKNSLINDQSLTQVKKERTQKFEEYNKNFINRTLDDVQQDMIPEGHPYRITYHGIKEQIDTLSVSTCTNFYNKYYNPNNSVLVLVGDIVPDKVLPLIFKYLGSIEQTTVIPPELDLSVEPQHTNKILSYDTHVNDIGNMFGQLSMITFVLPSSRDDDTIILDFLFEIITLDFNNNGPIANRYTNNQRNLTMTNQWFQKKMGSSFYTVWGFNLLRKVSPIKIRKQVIDTYRFIGENGIDDNIIDQYKKTYLLEKYNDNKNYYHNTYRLGTAELINGDYRTFTKEYELLKNLSNEDIKRVASTYLTNENLFFANISVNKQKWYTRFVLGPIFNTAIRINPNLHPMNN